MEAWARAYEPLVRSTTIRWCDLTELDPEDFAQELRLKVWQALDRFEPGRMNVPEGDEERRLKAEKSYVFSLVFNRVKDLLGRKKHHLLSLEVVAVSGGNADGASLTDRFEARYLCSSGYEVEGLAGESGYLLPDALSEMERAVLLLRYMDVQQVEMPAVLGVPLREVKKAMRSLREQLAAVEPERPAPFSAEVTEFPSSSGVEDFVAPREAVAA